MAQPEKDRGRNIKRLDWLENDSVKRILNQNQWDEARYLIILYVCSNLQPYALQAETFDGQRAFRHETLQNLAKEIGLDFEFFHGAIKMFGERLEKSFGYVKSFSGPDGTTYYVITPEGTRIAEAALVQARNKARMMETVLLPDVLIEKFKEDLQRRAKAKHLDRGVVSELLAEYENQDAMSYTPEAASTSRTRNVKLGPRTFTIGRIGENAISFPNDRFISRKHAKIEWNSGDYWIEDLDSRNGTWRVDENGKRARVKREKINFNSHYVMGTARLKFML
jgi:hypothetical protein